jgi:uncharacterized protein YdaU (DUF1376 family)
MHYYQHNIGDFDKATRHLTRIERSIYRDLIELYYNDEIPLINDTTALCRKIIARTDEEITAVEQVLNEFFYLDDDCWNNTRCNKEINAYHTNQKSKSKAGLASAEARKRKAEARKQQQKQQDRTDVQHVSNTTSTEGQQNIKHKPITNNQLKKESKKKTIDYSSWPAMPDKQLLADWMQVRKSKKSVNTQTAINALGKQLTLAVDAGYTVDQCITIAVERSWAGFKFEWLQKTEHAAKQSGLKLEGNVA